MSTEKAAGNAFMAAQGLSSLMNVAQGAAYHSASNNEADQLNLQAEQALYESRLEALQKKDEVVAFREDQAHAYLDSGVMLQGSPMAVLSETVRKGNQEIDALNKRGEAISSLYRMKAAQAQRAGTYGLLGGITSGLGGLANALVMGHKIGMFGNTTPTTPTNQAALANPITPSSPMTGDFPAYGSIGNIA